MPAISHVNTAMYGLRTKKSNRAHHVCSTCGYLRKQPVLCFVSPTQAKWFNLNSSSLCVIVAPENHQSFLSVIWGSARSRASPEKRRTEDRGMDTPWEVLCVHRNTMFCISPHAMLFCFLEATLFTFQACGWRSSAELQILVLSICKWTLNSAPACAKLKLFHVLYWMPVRSFLLPWEKSCVAFYVSKNSNGSVFGTNRRNMGNCGLQL